MVLDLTLWLFPSKFTHAHTVLIGLLGVSISHMINKVILSIHSSCIGSAANKTYLYSL